MNDQARLDEAVARVLNLQASRNHPKGPMISYWDEANNWERIPCPSQDWNALMAAVTRLEERGHIFQRCSIFEMPPEWTVTPKGRPANTWFFGDMPETEALARCILAVVEKEDVVL